MLISLGTISQLALRTTIAVIVGLLINIHLLMAMNNHKLQ